jgi:hypothetical protein
MTLQAIGFTLGGGLCVSILATIAFGIAVSRRSTNIAPRCTARHPNTIYRSRGDIYKKKKRVEGKNAERTTGNIENNAEEGNKKKSTSAAVVSTPLKPLKRTSTLAAKLVTGLDLNGLSLAEQKQRLEQQEEQQREFKVNAIGQNVYVGGGARSKVEKKRGTLEELELSSAVNRADNNAQLTVQGQLYDVDSGIPLTSINETNNYQPTINETTTLDDNTTIHPQDRGNPFLGWIPWTLHLSYDRMLRGIPGTGTREGGMGGKLLGVNLDAVVLFRFHGEFIIITMCMMLCEALDWSLY